MKQTLRLTGLRSLLAAVGMVMIFTEAVFGADSHVVPGAGPIPVSGRRAVVGRDALPGLPGLRQGQTVHLPRPGWDGLEGVVQRVERVRGRVLSVGGRVAGSPRGTFFLSEEPGGPRGLILLPDEARAYAVSSLASGEILLEEKALTDVMCIEYAAPAGEAPPSESDLPDVDPPPSRQSRPGTTAVIYLDMDGELVTSSSWNGGNLIHAASPNFSATKAIAIWERVAEDFRPFDVNVTTDLQVYLAAPQNRRIRCIITPSGSWYGSAGGVAYVGSFDWSGDTPCWVFNTGEKSAAEAASHEVGHTLGLGHDGQNPDTEYYGGHGSGATGWAPIMGVGYNRNLVQWSKGEYRDANRTQDDLQIITTSNGFTYRRDEHGGTRAGATPLTVSGAGALQGSGVVERNSDVDALIFNSRGGPAVIHVEPSDRAPNLDVLAELYDGGDRLVASSNPETELDAEFSVSLEPGLHVLRISGAGKGDPLGTGYTDYASLGQYTISGTIAAASPDQTFSVEENLPAPRTIGTLSAVANPDQDPLDYTILNGNVNSAFSIDAGGVITLADGALLDHEVHAGFDLLLRVDNVLHPETQTNLYIRVDVVDVNEPPVLTQAVIAVDLAESPPTGELVASVHAVDAEGPVTYEVSGGNESGGFVLDPDTGSIRVANPAVLFANVHPEFDLTVVASDAGSPSLAATATVQVVLWHELVSEGAPVRVRVPSSSGEDAIWRSTGFADGHWTEGVTGVGYDRQTTYDALLGTDVESLMYSGNQSVYMRLPFPAAGPAAYTQLRLRMKYDDGFVAYLNASEVGRRNAPSGVSWSSGATSVHDDGDAVVYETLDISAHRSRLVAGGNLLAIHGLNSGRTSSDALFLPVIQATYAEAVGVLSPVVTAQSADEITDSAAALTVELLAGGEAPAVQVYWGTTDGGTNELGWANVEDLGVLAAGGGYALSGLDSSTRYYFRFVAVNGAGTGWARESGSFITPEPPMVFVTPATIGRVIVPTDDSHGTQWRGAGFDDLAWPRRRVGVGYERGSGYTGLFYTDLESSMYGNNETAYLRAPFHLATVPVIQALTLKMKYDDAFVAYLNGQEIARSPNAPATLAWNSGATGVHEDSDAVEDVIYDLAAHTNLLQTGGNVLAIHGLNRELNSSDFLIAPTLVAVPAPVQPWTYARWIAQFGLSDIDSAPEADADHDEWSNVLEYVLGGDPTQADAATLAPVIRINGVYVEYTYTRRVDPASLGLVYQVESSVDLLTPSWNPVVGQRIGDPQPHPGGLTEAVTYRFAFPSVSSHLRLRVDLPALP